MDILTVQPALFESPLGYSIVKRAQDKKLVDIRIHNIHDYATNKYKQVDDYQFGGGAGMVLMPEPLSKCIEKLKSERQYDEIIYLTPDGDLYNQKKANILSLKNNIIFICGHFKGIDERIRELYVTMEISIGDYVLTGGELATAIIIDSVVRLLPGVIGNEESALFDSFQDNLLAPPIYTRPSEFKNLKVPDVLLSGDTAKIEEWRMEKALEKTEKRRPDLLQ